MGVVIRSDRLLFFLPSGLSVFTNIEKMPPSLKGKPQELWQLDVDGPFPDEVEIFVPEDRPEKGYIRPKENLKAPFTKDNIIEVNTMFLIANIKKSVSKGTMYRYV